MRLSIHTAGPTSADGKKEAARKNDEQLFDFESGLCFIQQKLNCSVEASSTVARSREDVRGVCFIDEREREKKKRKLEQRTLYEVAHERLINAN